MPLRNVGNSPLAVFSLILLSCAVWTCGYQSSVGPARPTTGPTRAAAEDLSDEEGAGFAGAEAAAAYDEGGARPSTPRIRQAQGPESPLGVEIAIDDKDGSSLRNFHRALRRTASGEGQTRIVFFGASHVAADMFTGYVRRELQTRFGDAGRGFMLPVPPWKHYRRGGVRIEADRRPWTASQVRVDTKGEVMFGIAGATVETRRAGASGAIENLATEEFTTHTGLFDIYFLKQPEGGDFNVLLDGHPMGRVSTRSKTFETGYATYHVADAPHRLEIQVVGNGMVRLFGVALEREKPGVLVDTLGINGSRARYQLLWNEEMYREQLRRRNPDLLVIAYGTNETGDDDSIEVYESQLHQVIRRAKAAVPQASCLLIGPTDRPIREGKRGFRPRPRQSAVVEVQRRVAIANGCGFFDLVAFQGGPMSMLKWVHFDPPYAQRDYVHLTRRGYERLGQVLLGALLEGFEERSPGMEETPPPS